MGDSTAVLHEIRISITPLRLLVSDTGRKRDRPFETSVMGDIGDTKELSQCNCPGSSSGVNETDSTVARSVVACKHSLPVLLVEVDAFDTLVFTSDVDVYRLLLLREHALDKYASRPTSNIEFHAQTQDS